MEDFTAEKGKDYQSVSNQRFYMSPFSIDTLSFEKELNRLRIQYLKDEASILQPYITFSFFEKDIDTVCSIFDKIEQKSFRNKEKKKSARRKISPEQRLRRISIGLLIFLLLIILISLIR